MLIAANLRPPLTGVGPLLGQIRAATGLSAAASGLLTTLPLLVFAGVSPLAPALSRRLGTERALHAALVVLALGLLARSAGSAAALFAGTLLLGGGIAVANVLLPALVKGQFPARAGLMTALYSTTMVSAAGVASGVSVPLADAGLGWRGSLGMWALLVIVAFAAWIPYGRPVPAADPAAGAPVRIRLSRSVLAWDVTLFLALQSLVFYGLVTWLPTLLEDDGMSATTAGLMLGLMQVASIVTTMIAPIVAARRASQRLLVFASGALTLVSLAGLWTIGASAAPVWVIPLGLAMGAQFSLALTFLVLRAVDAQHTGALSAMAQSGGYLLAAVAPVGIGLLYDVRGSWGLPVLALAAAAVGLLLFGMRAGRPAQVGTAAGLA